MFSFQVTRLPSCSINHNVLLNAATNNMLVYYRVWVTVCFAHLVWLAFVANVEDLLYLPSALLL